MNLFYAPDITSKTNHYTFDKDESRHIIKSLRKKNGDILFLTDGEGTRFEAQIISADPKHTQVKILSSKKENKRPYKIHIAIAPTKSNDRFEWFLEKAVEIGIDEITPLLTRYSERKKINLTRYEKIIVSAMKQSLQVYKPQLNELTKFEKFISQDFLQSQKYIAYCQAKQSLTGVFQNQQNILIIIGPEGGFSEEEVKKAQVNNFIPVSISPNRLRTETAGLVSLVTAHLSMKILPQNKQ